MIRKFKKGEGVKLSPHFVSDEFDCRCTRAQCDSTYIDDELFAGLEAFRLLREGPLRILSGYRCNAHNKEVGGAHDSFHPLGMAADIESSDPKEESKRAELVTQFKSGGIGIYPKRGFLHLDVRASPARWVIN
jgi:zinc D-Ala-D-Ala carboxypeptidase